MRMYLSPVSFHLGLIVNLFIANLSKLEIFVVEKRGRDGEEGKGKGKERRKKI